MQLEEKIQSLLDTPDEWQYRRFYRDDLMKAGRQLLDIAKVSPEFHQGLIDGLKDKQKAGKALTETDRKALHEAALNVARRPKA